MSTTAAADGAWKRNADMQVLIDNFDQILDGFIKTIWLLLFGGLIALVLGTVLAAMRVSPVGIMRSAGTLYINLVRNTPLLLILFFMAYAAPDLGFRPGVDNDYFDFQFMAGVAGLGLYTAAFVCEALRSGINSIPLGQAEAARAIGMTFGQSMRSIVLPQAFRAVLPPLANTFIALAKNTSVALTIGVTEAGFVMKKMTNDNPGERWWIFFGFAAGYVLIVWAISSVTHVLERRGAVSR
jgi:glutamate transport system permease protein